MSTIEQKMASIAGVRAAIRQHPCAGEDGIGVSAGKDHFVIAISHAGTSYYVEFDDATLDAFMHLLAGAVDTWAHWNLPPLGSLQ